MSLIGNTLTGAVAAEFWRNGKLVDPLCCVFFQTRTGTWRLYLDDESCAWRIESTEQCPRPSDVEGDSEFWYPHRDFAQEFGLLNDTVIGLSEQDADTNAEMAIRFESARTLVFTYIYESERTQVRLVPTAAASQRAST